MTIQLRQETPADHPTVASIIREAFKTEPHSDQTEHLLVERLRQSDAFIPELSIIAEVEGKICGHVLVTKIEIVNGEQMFPSLALAPVAVHPNHQKKGIGGALIKEAHRVAKEAGFLSIVLLGHDQYYPRFGYQRCSQFGIQLPFEAPDENCMVIELVENGLQGVSGMVQYSKAFFE